VHSVCQSGSEPRKKITAAEGGTGPLGRTPSGPHLGLYHIGIKIGDSLDELREAKKELEQAGVTITGMSDHTVSQSLYLIDPDGNEVEIYVDADPAIWQQNPAAVLASIKSLRL
jgi:catechol 2,3-dioxygenase